MPKISASPMYLGVDPGGSGGLALITPQQIRNGMPVVAATGMPQTEKDIWLWIKEIGEDDDVNDGGNANIFACIEKVAGAFRGSGGNIGSAMFKFGMSYGLLRMALIAASIPFEEVPPQRWQKGLKIPDRKKSETNTQWKNRLKSRAQQIFPMITVTLKTADALLLAEYCRRYRTGCL